LPAAAGLLAALACAAVPAGASAQNKPVIRPDEPPPINDPAPPSPIDRPKSEWQRMELDKKKAPEPEAPPLPPRQPGVIWLGWTFGSGYGWHNEQQLETANLQAGLGHFGPEVGSQAGERYALVLASRHQIIPKNVTDPMNPGDPKQWGHTLLAKALYIFPSARFQLFAGGLLGGGSGFRFRVDPQPSKNLPTSDTVRGGPIVVGPVAGITYPLADRLALVGEARLLAGAPDFATMAELNIGLQFDAFSR
jgi:hypothetical protein